MDYEIQDVCRDCGVLLPIVNKKYWLCDGCNFKRLHKGKTKQEVYKERHDKKLTKKGEIEQPKYPTNKNELVGTLKKMFSIKKISNKKAHRDREMHKTYNHIDQTRDPICEGCGRGDRPLSHSHVLSQAKRPDLAAEEDNIRLHCFGNYTYCHEKWERGIPHEVIEMDDFKDNLSYIEWVDPAAHNAIIANFEFNKVKI